jgi:hypothetical protein
VKTITVQIGNSDDKLTQSEWSDYVDNTKRYIQSFCEKMHFFGGSATYKSYQNVAFVFEIRDRYIEELEQKLKEIRESFKQDSIAWSESVTKFI